MQEDTKINIYDCKIFDSKGKLKKIIKKEDSYNKSLSPAKFTNCQSCNGLFYKVSDAFKICPNCVRFKLRSIDYADI